MTFNMSTSGMCSLVQSLPILLIIAQKQQTCLDTPLIYHPPQTTLPPLVYDQAVNLLLHAIENHTHAYEHHYEHAYQHGHEHQDHVHGHQNHGHGHQDHGHGHQNHGHGHQDHGSPHYNHDYDHGYGTPYYEMSHGNYGSGAKVLTSKKQSVNPQTGIKVYTKAQSGTPQVYGHGVQVYYSPVKGDNNGYPRTYTSGVKINSVKSKDQTYAPGMKVYSVNMKGQSGYQQTYAPGMKVYSVNMKSQSGYPQTYAPGMKVYSVNTKGPSGYSDTKEYPVNVNKYKVVIQNRRRKKSKLVQEKACTR